MRAVLKVLFWGLLAVTITVGGAYFYLRNADLNAYEEQIERFLTGIIGLQVDFDGRFDLRFGRTTTIAAENISLTNTAIADNSRILHVAAFEVSVNTWSLLSRPVVIENLVVGGASVALHRDADGHANWITDSAADASAVQARPRDSVELDVVVFRRVDLEDVRISLDDATRSHPVQATLHSLAVVPDAAGMLDIDLDGVVGAYPLLVDGTVGPLQGLVSGRDIAADLRATLGLMQLTILGEVAELSGLEGLSLKIGAEGPGIERLIDAFALPPFAEGAFSLDFGIAPDANGNSVNAGGNIGSIVLSVDGRVDDLLSPNEAELDVAFSGPESAYVASLFGVEDATRAAFDVSGGFRKTASRFDLEDVDITLGRSRAQISGWLETGSGFPEFDILIEGSGPNLAVFDPFIPINGLPDKPYDIAGRLRKQDDEWLFDDVDAWIGENRITADGRAEGGGSVDGQIRFRATGPDLSVLRQITGIEQLPAGPYTVTANLRGATNGIRIHSASAEINGNHVDASGYVSVEQGGVGSEIDLRVSGPELATIGAFSGIPNLPDGAFDISGHINVERSKVSLSAVSVAVQELTATAGGNIYHDADVPRIEFDIDAAGPDIADVFPYSPLDRLTGEPFRVYGGLLVEGNDLTLTDLHAL